MHVADFNNQWLETIFPKALEINGKPLTRPDVPGESLHSYVDGLTNYHSDDIHSMLDKRGKSIDNMSRHAYSTKEQLHFQQHFTL